jgi:serine/threonine protein kinase
MLSSPAVSNNLEDLLPSERSQFNSGSAPSPSYPVTTTTQQPQSTSNPSSRTGSRNDLFFTTTPQISRQTTPEPRDATPPPPLPLANASPSTPAIRISRPTTLNLATPTRTSSFYDLLPVIPTSPLRIDFASANEYMTIDHVSPIQEAFDDSNDPLLDRHRSPRLRLSPQNDFQLGEGRHASVYMASLIPLTDGGGKGEDDVEVETGKEVEGAKWKVCAAKRLLPDRESQAAGLGEAFMLSKLASTPSAETANEEGAEFILKLYGIKDERDGVESVPSLGGKRISKSSGVSLSRRSLPATSICPTSLRPPLGRVSSSAFPTLSTVAATPGSSPHLADNRELPSPPEPPVELSRTSAIARRDRRPRYSEPPLPTITTHTDGSGSTPVWPIRRKSIVTLASSPPNPSPASLSPTSPAFQPLPPASRIILLLEYCPFGHLLSFLKNYPERVGERRWIEWAIQLAKALALVHERGILHADIKPQNILVSLPSSSSFQNFEH